jgi:hypothetical protein
MLERKEVLVEVGVLRATLVSREIPETRAIPEQVSRAIPEPIAQSKATGAGIQGDTGADSTVQGDTGNQGDTGSQGDTGISGSQGDTGADGDTGGYWQPG